MIERLDALVGLMDSIDKTLRRHERILEQHGQALEEIKSDLLHRAVHYGDWVILESEAGKTRAGILRDSP